MATYYVDYEGGNDANNGLSFANRRKTYPSFTLSGGDVVRIMASPDPTEVGPAGITSYRNTIRGTDYNIGTLYGSTTVGQSYFYNSYLRDGDIINIWQNYNNIGVNGTWRITVSGQTCYIDGYSAPSNTVYSNAGYFCNYTQSTLYLNNAVTKTIASTGGDGRSAWTPSTDVQASKQYNWSFYNSNIDYTKEGSIYDYISIGANFTTGKAAYYQTGTLDLSSYQQVSFWIRIANGNVSTSNLSLRLCSDTSGDTTVNTITIPAIYNTSYYVPITVNLGTNLGSSIQSIALYVDSDQGSQTVYLSNIIACKAASSPDSLTLNSLVGLNTTTDPFWYGIDSINEKIVVLSSRGPNQKHSYYSNPGVYFSNTGIGTGTPTIYKREPITYLATSTGFIQISSASNASTSNRVTVSGGWNRTDMSTQTGITFIDRANFYNYGIYLSYNYYYSFNNIGFVRSYTGLYFNGASYCEFTGNLYSIDSLNSNLTFNYADYLEGTPNFILSGASTEIYGGQSQLTTNSYSPKFYASGGYNCFQLNYVSGSTIDTINAYYGVFVGLRFNNSNNNKINNIQCRYGGANFGYSDSFVFTASSGNIVSNVDFSHIYYGLYIVNSSNNVFSNINFSNVYPSQSLTDSIYSIYMNSGVSNYVIGGSVDKQCYVGTEIYTKNLEFTTQNEYSLASGAIAYSKNHDNVSNSTKTFFSSGRFEQSTEQRHTASGYSWKFLIQSSSYTSTSPAEIPLAKVAAQANSQVTLKLWVYRNGTGIVGGFRVKGGFVDGISSDITSYGTGNANVWEEITITCTPTEDAVLDVRAVAYYNGNTNNYVWIDDFSASQ
jgi:hypothetical protein